jgi:hypothetical protein
MLGDEVILDVHETPLLVHPLECVAAVAVVEAPALRGAVVAEEHEAGVVGFGGVGEEVEKGIVVEKEVGGVACLGADDVGALNGVATEEDGL